MTRQVVFILSIFLCFIPHLVYGQVWMWNELAPATTPSDRWGHAGLVNRNNFYIFGGYKTGVLANDIMYMDLTVPEWYSLTPIGLFFPSPRYGHSMVYTVVNGVPGLLIFGGDDGSKQNDLWFYNIALNTWLQISGATGDIPAPVTGHSAGVDLLGNMIIFGGETDTGYSNSIYIYSPPPSNIWTLLTPSSLPPPARSEHTGKVVGGSTGFEIYVFGGKDASIYYNDVWAYNALTTNWVPVSTTGSTPAARASHTTIFDAGTNMMLVFGGEDATKCFNNSFILDLNTKIWTQLIPGTAPDARSEHVSIWDTGSGPTPRMVSFGGHCDTATFSDSWELKLGTPSATPTTTYTVHTSTPTLIPSQTPTPTGTWYSITPTPTVTDTNPSTDTPTITPTASLTPTVTSSMIPTATPTFAPLCDSRNPSAFEDIGGRAENETEAYVCDLVPATIDTRNQELRLYGFDNTFAGTIQVVRISVVYRTSAAPIKDSYRFELSLDGTFTVPITIVPDSLLNQPSYAAASINLWSLSYAEIGTLAVRCVTTKRGGPTDPYLVEWDCALIEIFGDCSSVTPTPIPTATMTITGITPTATLSGEATSTPTATPTITSTGTGLTIPAVKRGGMVVFLSLFTSLILLVGLHRRH